MYSLFFWLIIHYSLHKKCYYSLIIIPHPGPLLTHLSLASFLWDTGKQWKPDQKPHNAASDQVLHCLLTKCTFEIWMKLKFTTQHHLNSKWIRPNDKYGKFH